MIDRFQCAWICKNVYGKDIFKKKKNGAFISVEASDKKDFFKNAKSITKNFFAVINAKYIDELLCTDVEDKGDILKREDCLEKAFNLGKHIVSE